MPPLGGSPSCGVASAPEPLKLKSAREKESQLPGEEYLRGLLEHRLGSMKLIHLKRATYQPQEKQAPLQQLLLFLPLFVLIRVLD